MNIIYKLLNKILVFEEKPQQIGLCHLNETTVKKAQTKSITSKNVKLSDLMRRVS